ncbi:Ycf51 family protein [Oculatella sp. LEGE 06141]|uniref:Ycf51 family protein n=1 Tax=Oculatella sp. LEGE 06141 TaxID=1828648 RepID=UPI0018818032|nr:Ycf51 family protein [Oculatella sp. LEGE 06141]MBE9177568.1 Ycf51 family protein [Oculatella sp. LEGE 06141]
MLSTANFLTAAQWAGLTTLAFAVLAGLSFLFQWGLRFRLVGITGFMGVLTVGLFGLGLVPFTRTVVPGAVRFATVYDSGSTQTVIVVPSSITEPQLLATLQQAASDMFSPGRLSRGQDQLTIRARTVLHPEEGVSQPLVLGQVKRSLFVRDDQEMQIDLYRENLAKLPPAPSAPVQPG